MFTRHSTEKIRQHDIIKEIKKLLIQFDQAIEIETRIKISAVIFKYLAQHKWFIKKNKNIEIILKQKLVDFTLIWSRSNEFYYQLFGECIQTSQLSIR
jgi:hypothetical protein